MKRIDLIPREGTFYKANLHCHSTRSDGSLEPSQLKDLYKSGGYRILALTDHNVLTDFEQDFRALTDPDFLILRGYESDITTPDCGSGFPKTCHLNAIAKDPAKAVYLERPAEYRSDLINRFIQELIRAGYLVHYNHPAWSSEEPEDFLALRGCSAMEIYNHGSELLGSEGCGAPFYNMMLRHGMRLFCIAADDNHNFDVVYKAKKLPSDSFGGWTMIKAPELSYPAVIRALEAGEFYCSTGPQIHDLYLEDNKLCVDCSPVQLIRIKASGFGTADFRVSDRDDLTHAEFDLDGENLKNEPFVRLEAVHSGRGIAYANPLFL